MKTAVITLCIGEQYQKIAALTHPTIKKYADKIGSDFIVIDQRFYNEEVSIGYEKLQFRKYLEDYDRIIFLDTDLIVRPDTPSLFEFVPIGYFGAFNEGGFIPSRLKSLKESMFDFEIGFPKPYEGNTLSWYFNTGVMVFDQSHKEVFMDPPKFINHFYEQTYLNLSLSRAHVKLKYLSSKFNRMSHLDTDGFTKDHRLESHIVHYAGASLQVGFDGILKIIEQDLAQWEELSKNKYHIPKVIKVSVGGGLGDQIEAEPVVREIRRLYPLDSILVASHWPELFKDLDYEVESLDICDHYLLEAPYAVFHTYSNPDTEAWKYMTHVFSHSTDFSSNLAIQRVLPPEKKDIQIRYSEDDLNNMYLKLNTSSQWLEDAVIIHPGRSWVTKTMTPEFWNEVIQGCVAAGIKLIIFGKDGKDLQGLVPITIPEEAKNLIDAREKLSIKESIALLDKSFALVSNDSAPIHMAGPTDIWIIGIYTAKHPAFVIPFRKGEQKYKTIEINNRPDCWPCNIDATPTSLDEISADFCVNINNKFCCFPKSKDVIDCIKTLYLKNKQLC